MKAVALGLAGGVLWGASMLVMTLISVFTGYAGLYLHVLESVYPGFHVSISGAFIGLVYGFIDGFVALWILGLLYRLFSCCGSCCTKHSKQ
jgi:hypothetical protein